MFVTLNWLMTPDPYMHVWSFICSLQKIDVRSTCVLRGGKSGAGVT